MVEVLEGIVIVAVTCVHDISEQEHQPRGGFLIAEAE
jgi:hypothetical protein